MILFLLNVVCPLAYQSIICVLTHVISLTPADPLAVGFPGREALLNSTALVAVNATLGELVSAAIFTGFLSTQINSIDNCFAVYMTITILSADKCVSLCKGKVITATSQTFIKNVFSEVMAEIPIATQRSR